jgi:hypothetical protein
VAKDKDEIPNFEHLNLDGLEPAAEHPAAEPGGKSPDQPPQELAEEKIIEFTPEEPLPEPTAAAPAEPAAVPPEIPAEEFAKVDAGPAGETAEAPSDQLPQAPGGEPAPDFLADLGAEPAATGETHVGEGDRGEIEFGVSGEAGEELKTEEEHEPEQSEEQLADAAAARKLNIAALVLMAVGGLGVVAGFVVAFLKGVATWLAVLIGIHYAAPPALLLALGLFLFFAVKKSGGTATLDSIKQGRVYEAVLAVTFLALWIAGYCLLGELSRYGYDLKATKVDRGASSTWA